MPSKSKFNVVHYNRLLKYSSQQSILLWNQFIRNIDGQIQLVGANFKGKNLSEANLSKALLKGAFLKGTNLSGAILKQAILPGANLQGANLRDAAIQEANLERANLERANLSEANLQRARLFEANLVNSNLKKAELEGANLEWANLEGANLEGTKLNNTNLCGANFKMVLLCDADLEGANLEGANLEGANLTSANLKGANLSDTQLQWAYLNGAIIQKTNLQGANLKGADLCCAKIQGEDLRGLDLSHLNLKNANLKAATLIGVDLRDSNITGAELYGTSRDDWMIDNIKCDYAYWDSEGKERTPKDRDFEPGEFEELYKKLPTLTYYFSDEFTPITPLVMDKVVTAINQKYPQFDLKLDSFHSRGQPHAIFTVLHKKQTDEVLTKITNGYEKIIHRLEGKLEGLREAFSHALDKNPSYHIERIEHMGHKFGDINSDRDVNISTDNATITVNNTVNDIASLIAIIDKLNVPHADIDNLKKAIKSDQDATEHKDQSFGKNVTQWFSDMSMKAGSAAWRLAEGTTAGTAAGIILNALKAYYGWS